MVSFGTLFTNVNLFMWKKSSSHLYYWLMHWWRFISFRRWRIHRATPLWRCNYLSLHHCIMLPYTIPMAIIGLFQYRPTSNATIIASVIHTGFICTILFHLTIYGTVIVFKPECTNELIFILCWVLRKSFEYESTYMVCNWSQFRIILLLFAMVVNLS